VAENNEGTLIDKDWDVVEKTTMHIRGLSDALDSMAMYQEMDSKTANALFSIAESIRRATIDIEQVIP